MAVRLVRKSRRVESFTTTAKQDIHRLFVETARVRSQQVLSENMASAGGRVDMDWMVDGHADAPLNSVKSGGRIAFFYNPIQPVVDYAMDLLLRWAPVGTTPLSPKYKYSFIILTDAVRGNRESSKIIDWPGRVDGIYVEILDTQPYAGSLEPHTRSKRGPRVSRQAPNGIMELAAANLRARWGSVMKINLVSKQWPSIIEGKKPDYHLPTITISPNWRGINQVI